MLAPVTKISLSLAFCSMFWACEGCKEYQDMAGAEIWDIDGIRVDSVAVIANDSIVGCGNPRYRSMIGSKTHGIMIGSKMYSLNFPINAHIKLFVEDSLWKELSIEMHRNTVLVVYRGGGCSESNSSRWKFYSRMASAKKDNRYIDSYSADDFCWLFERMDSSYDNDRCIEWSTGGEADFCYGRIINAGK